MKTVHIPGSRRVELIDKPMPTIAANYAMVKVHVAPMCNEYLAYRDLSWLERNRPDSLGHELAGEVVESAPGSTVQPGDRVVALCGFPCGRCRTCREGWYAHCSRTGDPRVITGSRSGECGFAQYAIKPDWMLVQIPDSMSYDDASMACCGFGPTFGAMQRIGVDAFGSVLITGLGAVGLGGVINAKYRGATVIGVTRSRYRAQLAKELSCDVVLDPAQDDVRAAIDELTSGRGAGAVLECSGQPAYQRLAVDAVGRMGSVAFISEPGDLMVNVDRDLVQRGVTLLGTLDINRHDADLLLQMIADIPEQIGRFVTHRLPLSGIQQAFELQMARECGKILLYPWLD
jgi:threonine dehydrogenase-like Zn-dependent dehydrogenase